jgi:hypothetical protein
MKPIHFRMGTGDFAPCGARCVANAATFTVANGVMTRTAAPNAKQELAELCSSVTGEHIERVTCPDCRRAITCTARARRRAQRYGLLWADEAPPPAAPLPSLASVAGAFGAALLPKTSKRRK